MKSVVDIYKIGVGPSSSHTVGPMIAGKRFVDSLINLNMLENTTKITVILYGSLSLTGRGHKTDEAVLLGLMGEVPDSVDIDQIESYMEAIKNTKTLSIYKGKYQVPFSIQDDLVFNNEFLPLHENALTITAYHQDQVIEQQTYYSVGGGKIVSEQEFNDPVIDNVQVPYPIDSAKTLLGYCNDLSLPISTIIMKNELMYHTKEEINDHFVRVGKVMRESIKRGQKTDGLLPGSIKLSRRAPLLNRILMAQNKWSNDLMVGLDWINMFALAASEENAAGGRVVTAPTNGACGIIPAVLEYFDRFVEPITDEMYVRFFLTSGAIGGLYQQNASISGAEVGCQGEVGVACSMAAAGLTELIGGSAVQVCIAAEIAMEHHLGLTCDPVAGLVQVPCIERNAISAVKAVNSARMAMRRTTHPAVSLDNIIETMYNTGKDMNSKYRETSKGGLALTLAPCN